MSTTTGDTQNLSGDDHDLTAHERATIRAQMNDMSIERVGDDLAEVTNLEYPEDERYDHTYMVDIDPDASPKGEPVGCSCPGYSLGRYYCQHMAQVKRVLLGLDEPDADYREGADAGDEEDAGEAMTDGGGGCPHDHRGCEGVDSPRDRPELCPTCWEEWAAYDPEDYLLPEDEHVSVEEAREVIEAAGD